MDDIQIFLNYLDGKYPEVFGLSIDKISILGDWCYWGDGKHPFQRLLDLYDSPISIRKGDGTPEVEGYIFDKVWFKTNDKKRFKDVRDFKMEFNPKRLNHEERTYLKDKILPLLKRVGFTRIDFAFDIETDISNYIYFEGKSPKKVAKYIGKNGKLETMYIGSRESDWHACIYNKKKEKMKELLKEQKSKENGKGKEYVADLTDWERKQLHKRIHWWRIEIRVRREKADPEISKKDLFQSLHLVEPSYIKTQSIQDQSLIYFLTNFPDKIEQMNYNPKKRAQEMLLNTSEFNLVTVLEIAYAQDFYKLEYELKEYLSCSQLKEHEASRIYMSDEKAAIANGKDIDVEKLSFSSNKALKNYHNHNIG
ncbi:hypothetical protein QNH44_24980 [Cytobacillus firmus]|uniref:hypothetical protein n=1 Tax=Cytobacillus firmus TaxID=1399 RepID=UPI0024C20804|nr:hypothetical protein [Cytobacillus firmus]WHY34219.1 hypothetical protein QNH44_24980 [Cytobacillus firmus]